MFRKYFLPDKADLRWWAKLSASFIIPALILFCRPLSLTARQSAVVAGILLAVIWFVTNIIKRIPASIFLILLFLTISGAPLKVIFSFPLSETFPMIVLTYLFSQAISNCGLIDRVFRPLLAKYVHTPVQAVLATFLTLVCTVYIIPQPIARAIIVSTVFSYFILETGVSKRTYSLIIFSVFLWYSFVNIMMLDADIITNSVAASFANEKITNLMWVKAMLAPSIVLYVLVLASFIFAFRKDLLGIRFAKGKFEDHAPMTVRQKCSAAVIAATALLWMTSAFHGINNTVITLTATALLFATGALTMKDWKAIDISTIVFFTAAIGIGGVMNHCGAAEKVFGSVKSLFPAGYSMLYIFTMAFVIMAVHMAVGSITTSVSIVIPGLMVLCSSVVPDQIIVYLSVLCVTGQIFLPFHSVVTLIGETRGYYTSSFTLVMGTYETIALFLTIPLVYVPYWHFIGLL